MSLIQQSSEPEKVEFEDLRMGDLIRVAKVDDARHNLQFVVTELDDMNVGGSFGAWEVLIPNLNTWTFYMLKRAAQIPKHWALGWVTWVDSRGEEQQYLGYWIDDGYGIIGHSYSPDKSLNHQFGTEQVRRWVPAFVSSKNPMDEPIQWTTTPPVVPTYPTYPYPYLSGPTCGCSAKGACWECR